MSGVLWTTGARNQINNTSTSCSSKHKRASRENIACYYCRPPLTLLQDGEIITITDTGQNASVGKNTVWNIPAKTEVKQTLMTKILVRYHEHFHASAVSHFQVLVLACHKIKKTPQKQEKNTIKITYSARWFRNTQSKVNFHSLNRGHSSDRWGEQGRHSISMRGHRVMQAFASASGKMELSLMISIKNINLDNSRAVGKRNWKEWTASSVVQIVIKYIDGASPRGHHQKHAFLCRENHTSWRLEDTQGEFSDHLTCLLYKRNGINSSECYAVNLNLISKPKK